MAHFYIFFLIAVERMDLFALEPGGNLSNMFSNKKMSKNNIF